MSNWSSSPIRELTLSMTAFSIDLSNLVINLKFLNRLHLSNCTFIRSYPQLAMLANLSKITSLDLSHNNFGGHIPWNIFPNLPQLTYLELSSNNLVGLKELILSLNQFTGTIQEFQYTSLSYLDLEEQFPWKNLESLDISSNSIQGHLSIPPPSTHHYFISNNHLFGEIPSLICTLTSIRMLDLSNNTLNGSIPPCLGNLSFLLVLNLQMNMFDGTIPITFAKGNTLRNIDLNGNRLKGPLPRALLNYRNLEILDLGNNMINDTFPQWLEFLPNLQVLVLRSNKFHGCISSPSVRFPFQKLRILDLSNNLFDGLLLTQYFENFLAMIHVGYVNKLKYMEDGHFPYYTDSVVVTIKGFDIELEHILNIFTIIDFSKNNFAGEIPKSIGNLKLLKGLNLSHNKLCGHIPTSLRNMSNLEWLDLSSNNFYGEIPMQLSEMMSLAVLNLSQNHLVGAIPGGNQFNTFENDSYIRNLGLCEFPLTKTCGNNEAQPPSPSADDDDEATNGFQWKYIYMGYASGLVIGISIGYMLFSDERLACLMRKVGGERWLKFLKRKKRANGGFSRRRIN
ncbi:hypothetical protein FNV43_RR21822 [Rhamnella rubrinervis]|uniref:Uncharacterized protein n=1 Tax=Rhamnella rubrinervis TaxID=2594499 RepID=A0A8K0E0R5_9ROSA|nr:hypothetical protein FNV43_RR21822 [Rhamnella rubrinervis]